MFPLSVKLARQQSLGIVDTNLVSRECFSVSGECCFSVFASSGVLCCCVAGLIYNTVAGNKFTCASQSAHSSCIMKGVTGLQTVASLSEQIALRLIHTHTGAHGSSLALTHTQINV